MKFAKFLRASFLKNIYKHLKNIHFHMFSPYQPYDRARNEFEPVENLSSYSAYGSC